MKMNEINEGTLTYTRPNQTTSSPKVTDPAFFNLCDVEIETVRRAAQERGLSFDDAQRRYSTCELSRYGLVREGYNRQELAALGIGPSTVSSLDDATRALENELPLATPFGSGLKKFQLPIDMMPIRVAKTIFPPGSVVKRHIHPPHSNADPGGGLRIVVSGWILFEDRRYRQGDWFFVPNGTPYEFSTAPLHETTVFYLYRFFGAEFGNRFSHPYAT
ncbi:hypothetical protein [Burkholderia pseudomallei]|uniref:hypothetical protein n=1 Tax=Burkholderia pseudomallei TaxID=28450 RepID=UPI001177ACE8|nr:hypothetical protein [Burkholderia pseudomallei]